MVNKISVKPVNCSRLYNKNTFQYRKNKKIYTSSIKKQPYPSLFCTEGTLTTSSAAFIIKWLWVYCTDALAKNTPGRNEPFKYSSRISVQETDMTSQHVPRSISLMCLNKAGLEWECLPCCPRKGTWITPTPKHLSVINRTVLLWYKLVKAFLVY